MKNSVIAVLVFISMFNSLFALNWEWKQEGKEFLLLSPTGGISLGFKIKKAFMPIKFYTNNNSYLFFVDANDFLRAYKIRNSGSVVMNSLISMPLEKEWGKCIKISINERLKENEIILFFNDEKKRLFSINSKNNQFEMIEESYY